MKKKIHNTRQCLSTRRNCCVTTSTGSGATSGRRPPRSMPPLKANCSEKLVQAVRTRQQQQRRPVLCCHRAQHPDYHQTAAAMATVQSWTEHITSWHSTAPRLSAHAAAASGNFFVAPASTLRLPACTTRGTSSVENTPPRRSCPLMEQATAWAITEGVKKDTRRSSGIAVGAKIAITLVARRHHTCLIHSYYTTCTISCVRRTL